MAQGEKEADELSRWNWIREDLKFTAKKEEREKNRAMTLVSSICNVEWEERDLKERIVDIQLYLRKFPRFRKVLD